MSKLLIVSTNHLGNKNYNDNLFSTLNKLNIQYDKILLERNEGIISNFPFSNLLQPIYTSLVVYIKYLRLHKNFDIIFFHGSELCFFFSKIKSKKIMSLDAPRYSIRIPNKKMYTHNPIRYKIIGHLFRLIYKKKLSKINIFSIRKSKIFVMIWELAFSL